MDDTSLAAAWLVALGSREARTDNNLRKDRMVSHYGEALRAGERNSLVAPHLAELDILGSQKVPLVDDGQRALRCEKETTGTVREGSQERIVHIVGHDVGLGHRPATRRGGPHFPAP